MVLTERRSPPGSRPGLPRVAGRHRTIRRRTVDRRLQEGLAMINEKVLKGVRRFSPALLPRPEPVDWGRRAGGVRGRGGGGRKDDAACDNTGVSGWMGPPKVWKVWKVWTRRTECDRHEGSMDLKCLEWSKCLTTRCSLHSSNRSNFAEGSQCFHGLKHCDMVRSPQPQHQEGSSF